MMAYSHGTLHHVEGEISSEEFTMLYDAHQKYLRRDPGYYKLKLDRSVFNHENFTDYNFTDAHFAHTIFRNCNFKRCDFTNATFHDCIFNHCEMIGANFTGTVLSDSVFGNVNLSQSNLDHDPAKYIKDNFEHTAEGIICYKTFNTFYGQSPRWTIGEGCYINEKVNLNIFNECGSGVNVGTLAYIEQLYDAIAVNNNDFTSTFWRCLIEWIDLAGVVVPVNSEGKIRASRVKLLQSYNPTQMAGIFLKERRKNNDS